MIGTRWQICRVRGIAIRVDVSWLLIFGLLSLSLCFAFREAIPDLAVPVYAFMGGLTALAVFTCIVLHELGHALVARSVGIRIRGITLFVFGGVAEMEDEPSSARAEFVMAIAGPAVSMFLAILFAIASTIALDPLAFMFRLLAHINVMLLAFNLVPAFPLDGGRVLRALLWWSTGNLKRATYSASLAGQTFAMVLMTVGGLLFLAGGLPQGLWLGLIGMFLYVEAGRSYQTLRIREALGGEPVSRFMNPVPITVPPHIDLRRWLDHYVYQYYRKAFPVAFDGHLLGLITTDALLKYPSSEWARHTVGKAMRKNVADLSIAPDADALAALQKMVQTGAPILLVTEKGSLLGTVSRKDLETFLELRLELTGQRDANDQETRTLNESPDAYQSDDTEMESPRTPILK